MTVYARGYRPFHGERTRRGPRFLPIWLEGRRDAVRGRGYFWMRLIVVGVAVFIATAIYFAEGPLRETARQIHESSPAEDVQRAHDTLAQFLRVFYSVSNFFFVLLALFIGSSLVAEDVRLRALSLYLVRPITPLDYYLGKFLISVTVLGLVVLVPGLLLVLFDASLRPSGQAWSFLWAQRALVGGLALHAVVLATGYASVVLLVSSTTSRRLTAIVFGAIAFFGSEAMAFAMWRLRGPIPSLVRALSPLSQTSRVLDEFVGLRPWAEHAITPPVSTVIYVWALFLVLAAASVYRRASTTEVVA